jgi:hypothetical protein
VQPTASASPRRPPSSRRSSRCVPHLGIALAHVCNLTPRAFPQDKAEPTAALGKGAPATADAPAQPESQSGAAPSAEDLENAEKLKALGACGVCGGRARLFQRMGVVLTRLRVVWCGVWPGNQAISGKDYRKAVDLYSQAISLASRGPNSHIYYCNRAAAWSHLEEHGKGGCRILG